MLTPGGHVAHAATQRARQPATWPQQGWSVLALVAALVYGVALFSHTVNWPFTDDHTATLGFLIDWQAATSAPERLHRWVAAHNEHRLMFSHLIELADVTVFGQVDFRHLVIVGNLCWALAILILMLAGRQAQLSWSELTPVAILGFTLSHHDLMIWAMGSLQQYGQILFCLLAVWAAAQGRWIWSLAAALVAAGAGGGGFAVFPALALCFMARRQWARAVTTLLLLGISLHWHMRDLSAAAQGHGRVLHVLQHPLEAVGYVLCFLGSVGKSTQASIVLGAISVSSLAWLLWREDAMRRQPFFTTVAVWLLTCGVLAAISRLPLGVDQARSTRYTPHAIVLISSIGALAVSLASHRGQRRLRWRIWAVLSVLLWATWLVHGWRQQAQQADAMRAHTHIAPPSREIAQQILHDARRTGVFTPASDLK